MCLTWTTLTTQIILVQFYWKNAWLYHSVDFESLDNSSYYWIVIRNIKTRTRNILAFQKVTLSKTINFLCHCFFIYKTEEQKYFLYRLAVKHYCWVKHFVHRVNFLNLNFISSTINFTLNTINSHFLDDGKHYWFTQKPFFTFPDVFSESKNSTLGKLLQLIRVHYELIHIYYMWDNKLWLTSYYTIITNLFLNCSLFIIYLNYTSFSLIYLSHLGVLKQNSQLCKS